VVACTSIRDSPGWWYGDNTSETIEEQVFLLSENEIYHYFAGSAERVCDSCEGELRSYNWLLRTAGNGFQHHALRIEPSGQIQNQYGHDIRLETLQQGIRPTMWLDWSSAVEAATARGRCIDACERVLEALNEDEPVRAERLGLISEELVAIERNVTDLRAQRAALGVFAIREKSKTDARIIELEEQRRALRKEREAIERVPVWEALLLDVTDEMAMVVTKNAVAEMRYNESLVDCFWEDCSLRAWLNGEFLVRLPESTTRKIIIAYPMEDKVFLLSADETVKHWPRESDRTLVVSGGNRPWWLRGKFWRRRDNDQGFWREMCEMPLVRASGEIQRPFRVMGEEGERERRQTALVRPAMWVSLKDQ